MKKIIENLVAFGNRQGIQADLAYKYLISLLKQNNIPYRTEIYKIDLPIWKKCILKADGVSIPCLPTGLNSGKITNISALTSSLISSSHFINIPHINFNPKSENISRANFSFAPSFAISKDSLLEICNAKQIYGELIVEKRKQNTYQILVGNIKNPKNIIFSHFDSIGKGAIDNASGIAVMIQTILSNKRSLENNLFVFDGNEEISYDKPVYWGKGYRNFEKKYSKQISKAKKLIIIDCIGYDKTVVLTGKLQNNIIELAFPIKNINKYSSKIMLITSDYDKLMNIYHSDLDIPRLIKESYLEEALKICVKEVEK